MCFCLKKIFCIQLVYTFLIMQHDVQKLPVFDKIRFQPPMPFLVRPMRRLLPHLLLPFLILFQFLFILQQNAIPCLIGTNCPFYFVINNLNITTGPKVAAILFACKIQSRNVLHRLEATRSNIYRLFYRLLSIKISLAEK
jgi:hypothetical protein